jgi:branched-chain amino acid transport system substrate-binding protein
MVYNTARAAIHGIGNADTSEPRWVGRGIERIPWPATNGGPATYVQIGPGDHKGYKGNFLRIRELMDGGLRFMGCYRA